MHFALPEAKPKIDFQDENRFVLTAPSFRSPAPDHTADFRFLERWIMIGARAGCCHAPFPRDLTSTLHG
jgi:hypothetical protein